MSEAVDGEMPMWRCRYCGNVVLRNERPTECYHCRRGESDLQLNDDRLFVEISLEEMINS